MPLLLDDEVRVVDYSFQWVALFEELSDPIRRVLGSSCARVDHIGSTAVPGLAAKPIVDIGVGLEEGRSFAPDFAERCGLVFRAVNRESVLFAAYRDVRRVANVHVRAVASPAERWDRLVRDFLRAHPDVAAAYAEVKRAAARAWPADREAYSRAKGPFIAGLEERMEAWAVESSWS